MPTGRRYACKALTDADAYDYDALWVGNEVGKENAKRAQKRRVADNRNYFHSNLRDVHRRFLAACFDRQRPAGPSARPLLSST